MIQSKSLTSTLHYSGMNVVMPTGMITMHQDPRLSEQSQRTSERGSRILASILSNEKVPLAQDKCRAILVAASDKREGDENPQLIEVCITHWKDLSDKTVPAVGHRTLKEM